MAAGALPTHQQVVDLHNRFQGTLDAAICLPTEVRGATPPIPDLHPPRPRGTEGVLTEGVLTGAQFSYTYMSDTSSLSRRPSGDTSTSDVVLNPIHPRPDQAPTKIPGDANFLVA